MQDGRGVWKDEAGALTIEWPLSLLERLGLDALEAFKSLPRRGLEIGGLLLGSVRTSDGHTTVRIEDYQPVPSEHRFGPSYVLSEVDFETFDGIFARHPEAVGMYRTDTHSNSLILQKDTGLIFQRHFMSPESILLLVHPASRKAAFCRNSAGGLSLVHVVPIYTAGIAQPAEIAEPEPRRVAAVAPPASARRASEMRLPGNEAVAVESRQTVVASPAPEAQPRGVGGARPRRFRGEIWTIRAAALMVGGLLGAFAWRVMEPRQPATHPAAPVSNSTGVALRVNHLGQMLLLAWDRDAAGIADASHAILHVTDGNRKIDLPLTPTELGSGRFSYWPATRNVTFRLDTFRANRNTGNAVGVVANQPINSGVVAASGPALPRPATSRQAEVHRWAKASSDDRETAELETNTASRAEFEAPRPAPFSPLPKPAPAPVTASIPPAVAPPKAAPEPRIEVSAVPEPPSRWSRALGHVPLLRRLKKQSQVAVPPQPVHEARPSLSAAERRDLITEVPIDVRVYITESGKVDFAELLDTKSATRHPELADDAVFAARRWSFRPARLGNDDVASQMVLHFIFKPPDEVQP